MIYHAQAELTPIVSLTEAQGLDLHLLFTTIFEMRESQAILETQALMFAMFDAAFNEPPVAPDDTEPLDSGFDPDDYMRFFYGNDSGNDDAEIQRKDQEWL